MLLPADASLSGLFAGLSLADGLAVFGGFMFALTNVLLRRFQSIPAQARMLAMFAGCMSMGLLTALFASGVGMVPGFPAFDSAWATVALGLAILLMLGNWALQFGAAHLPSGVTSVVMLSEVVFASVSSVLIAHEALSGRTLAGGALIMSAALLASLGRGPKQ